MGTTELRVTLPGPDGAADAWRATAAIQRLLLVLGQIEDKELHKRAARNEDRSRWGFVQLTLGSVVATLAPSEPRRGATLDTMVTAIEVAVDGFAEAEVREGIPPGWDTAVAETAADLARLFSAVEMAGMHLEVIENGRTIRDVTVTRAAEEHLTAGLRQRRRSIGSALGRLDSASLHHKHEAGLWLERTGERIAVSFTAQDIDVIRSAWGRRVEVSGILERDPDGRLVRVRMQRLEILADRVDSPPLTDLVGLDEDLTGGLSSADYLRKIRGAS